MGNTHSVTTQVTFPNIGQTSPALLCVLPFSLEGGIDNENNLLCIGCIIQIKSDILVILPISFSQIIVYNIDKKSLWFLYLLSSFRNEDVVAG